METLLFLGDVYLPDKNYHIEINEPYVFNLEYAMAGDALPVENKICLKGDEDLCGLSRKPIAVCLANNHVLDFGDEGFIHTKERLRAMSIPYFGAGDDEDNCNNPCIITLGSVKAAILGYNDIVHILGTSKTAYRTAQAETERICRDIERARSLADYVIVNIHWGQEERHLYNKKQQQLGRACIDAGADVVIGHHPHCIQPIELYKGKYIYYSLGNSFFPDTVCPAYYKDGVPQFNYHKKHLNYGRKSLAVRVCMEKGSLRCETLACIRQKDAFRIKAEIKPRFRNSIGSVQAALGKVFGYMRVLAVFIRSNFFTDGKIINTGAVKKEFEFIGKRRKKS